MSDPATHDRINGQTLAAISTGMVRLYARYSGRGSPQTKTHICGDTVICVMGEPFSAAERMMLDAGEGEAVLRLRDAIRRATEPEAKAIVEKNCGREVIACLGMAHADPDVSVRIFVLEPRDAEGPPAVLAPLAVASD